jgi:hypothetical protein
MNLQLPEESETWILLPQHSSRILFLSFRVFKESLNSEQICKRVAKIFQDIPMQESSLINMPGVVIFCSTSEENEIQIKNKKYQTISKHIRVSSHNHASSINNDYSPS